MVDIHSHILPGIDDGSKTMEESIKLLKDLSEVGFTDIVLTPHYVYDSNFVCNNKEKLSLLTQLEKELENNKINLNLYLGNEIYITENIDELILKDEIKTMNNTKYILVEFPLSHLPHNAINIVDDLIYAGYKVILAHPERYPFVIDDVDNLEEFVEMGVLLQPNYTSLFGKYGKEIEKTLKKIMKKYTISFIGSDTHKNIMNKKEKDIRKKLKKYYTENQIEDILNNNFNNLLK